jgi:hypothetical protein
MRELSSFRMRLLPAPSPLLITVSINRYIYKPITHIYLHSFLKRGMWGVLSKNSETICYGRTEKDPVC